ncbi:ADP-ribosylglycohydrolase family protein [Haloimpatiens lingqiaonensis]|uniref:ADP-ribosylglycohydrolase family protein n=1 Tax=Haloimpatiens lingqiaonensis TaxID=1380675 RepID=UPI0010FE4431|nr:ADP-ribosylglycohydrolase family protein [Haloimpatiens lingqiaonensis]
MSETTKSRILSCLKGLAVGDAIGKQTETLSFEKIKEWYPNCINGFEGKLGTIMPRYIDRHYEWKFGETTDDTEQTIAVAESIIEEGTVSHSKIGEKLMLCKKSNRPTLQLGKFQQLRDVNRVVYDGDGCGAAMRVAPIGIIHSSDKLHEIVSDVFECCIPTHGSQLAICAAASIAGAVSAAIDGKSIENIFEIALKANIESEKYRKSNEDLKYCEALMHMYQDLSSRSEIDINYLNENYFPKTTINIVPLSIVIALITKSAEKSTLLAANLGGDSDSVASMSSAIAGAISPDTVNNKWYDSVRAVNENNLIELGERLYLLRH